MNAPRFYHANHLIFGNRHQGSGIAPAFDAFHSGEKAISLHIIIDGYNLIRRSSSWHRQDAEDILLAREALIAQLAAYKRIRAHRITVVFDGTTAPPGTPHEDQPRGIRVRFSRSGETADAVIERMARRERERALVVSSDRQVAAAAVACGAAAVDANEFEHKMMLALYSRGDESTADPDGGWTPTTKKKGPARRPSRRARFNRTRIDKL